MVGGASFLNDFQTVPLPPIEAGLLSEFHIRGAINAPAFEIIWVKSAPHDFVTITLSNRDRNFVPNDNNFVPNQVVWDTVVVTPAPIKSGLTIARDTVLVQLGTQFLASRPIWDTVLGTQP